MDVILITWFLATCSKDRLTRVLEVGGGYGRLARAFLGLWPSSGIQYILVDAVPSSLLSAYEYLTKTTNHCNIQLVHDRPIDHDADVLLIGSWNLEAISTIGLIDLFVNIESFQEMSTSSVSNYLGMAERNLRPGSLAYISNSRVYVNPDAWPTPPAWECLFLTDTPRSWSRVHPTGVFSTP